MVELAVMERGMNMLDAELSEQEAKAHERAALRNGHKVPKENQPFRAPPSWPEDAGDNYEL